MKRPGKLSGYLLRSAVVASLGGFLFGFDTAVISGAEQTIQELWGLSDFTHGLAISMALWGTVVGAIVGGLPTDRIGRRATLLAIGVLYLVSAVWSALAGDVGSFMVARFLGGVGVGVSTIAAPLYISEISPARFRGRLAGMFQFNIVFGILIAFASNAIVSSIGENAWRWMLGVEAAPALFYTLMCLGIPESPRWLLTKRGDADRACEVLQRISPKLSDEECRHAIAEMLGQTAADGAAADAAEPNTPAGGAFLSRRMRRPLLLVFLLAVFNQLSGINAVVYFAPRIFEMAGLGQQAALLQSIGVGVTNLVFTLVGLQLIDRAGRRTLLLIGSVGYIASLGLCSWAFRAESFSLVPIAIFAFIASHAVGQGAVIWVLITEVFPTRFRAAGTALGSSTHWVAAALLTQFFPVVVTRFSPSNVFLFFAAMMALQLVWVLRSVPETKGVPLEEIGSRLGVR
ncbi:MAG: sugar porter family MFS transporter [Planctomycetota bacterium]